MNKDLKKLSELSKFLNKNGFKKEAGYLNKIKDVAFDFAEEIGDYVDPYAEEISNYIDPYVEEVLDVSAPYIEEAKSFVSPYVNKGADYLEELLLEKEKEEKSVKENFEHEVSANKNDSKFKEWSNPNNSRIGGGSNFSRVYGNNNYRSAKPINSVEFFEYLKEKYNIKTIIDLMNSSEGKNVNDAGLSYISIPMGDKPPSESEWNTFKDALESGNCLVHCHHGADRTGAMIAKWEVYTGQKTPSEAYSNALEYGFKSEDFKYNDRNVDPNRHLRDYIFNSEVGDLSKYKKEEDDDFLQEIKNKGSEFVESGIEYVRDVFREDKEVDSHKTLDYYDETGKTPINSMDIYHYLTSDKGVGHNHALGIIGNMIRESALKPGSVGDSGTSYGLFQMHGGRAKALEQEVPDWKMNWKSQIDHALKTDVGPKYLSINFYSPYDAAVWFERNYERPHRRHHKNESWYRKKLNDYGLR